MTLEEYLNYFTKENLENTKYGAIEYGFLKELEALREELEKNSKELEVYMYALELACWLLSKSSECFGGYCPLDKTISEKKYGTETRHCPDCSNDNMWREYFLQKAREE